MTPGARAAAAIDILDEILDGMAAEQALSRWARRSRFAGSKDRAAIRDHVFDVLRQRKTCAALGGGRETGRSLMIGLLYLQGVDTATVFTGEGYGPAALAGAEQIKCNADSVIDLPDWLIPVMQADLGRAFPRVQAELAKRAPVFLRVNTLKANRASAQAQLAEEGIITQPHSMCSATIWMRVARRSG